MKKTTSSGKIRRSGKGFNCSFVTKTVKSGNQPLRRIKKIK